MPNVLRKASPLADAQAFVDKIEAQRTKLVTRMTDSATRLEAARLARREALVAGDADDVAMAAIDKAFADAADTRAFVEEEITTVTAQLDEATRRRDELQDVAERQRIAEDEERRAKALDIAADRLSAAAKAFAGAREALVLAIIEHGIRTDHVLAAEGIPAGLIARPAILAAIRTAAPGVLPAFDGFGVALDADCSLVVRRGISGTLRDHAEDLLAGRVQAVEMPRPGSTAPAIDLPRHEAGTQAEPYKHRFSEPMARTVFAVPFSYSSTGGAAMLQGEPGDNEVPARVARKAEELELAFPLDSDEGRAIAGRLKASLGQYQARPRTFIDTEFDAVVVPMASARTVTTAWPDDRSGGARA